MCHCHSAQLPSVYEWPTNIHWSGEITFPRYVCHTHTTSIYHTTGYMPFFLMFGLLQARMQADLIFKPEALRSFPSDRAFTLQTTLITSFHKTKN